MTVEEKIMEEREDALMEGRAEGREEGRVEGETMMARLVSLLLEADRQDDIIKMTSDAEYRQSLYAEFGIA